MKKVLSITLCVVMMLSMVAMLGGCSEKEEANPIIGSWECTYDMADTLNAALASSGMGDYVEISEFELDMEAEFNKDGTYAITADEDSVEDSVKTLKADMVDGLTKYVEDTIAANGSVLTVDEFLAANGVASMEEFIDAMGLGTLATNVVDALNQEGNYVAKDGKLYTASGKVDTGSNDYDTYEIDGDTLTLTNESDGIEIELVFERVN